MTASTRAATPPMPKIAPLFAAQVSYQARLLASGRAVTIGVGFPVILLIASHGSHTQTTNAGVAGYAVFGLTLTAWNIYGTRLVAAREAGVLKRWWATPLPRWCYFLSRIVATVVVATAAGAATVAAGALLYNTHLTLSGVLGALVAFVVGAFAWAAAATALTSVIPTVEAAAPTFLVTYFPVIIVSGLFGSISEPQWLSTMATYLPAQPLAQAVATALGRSAGHPWLPARDLAVLVAWAVAGMAVATVTFRWEPHRSTQRRPDRPPPPRQSHHPRSGPGGAGGTTTAMMPGSTLASRPELGRPGASAPPTNSSP
jgi:ABC-2 type transport system permease protein